MPFTILSQSSLQDYTDCAQRFQLRYIEQLAYPAVETEPALENEQHMQEGETFHRLIQQHLLGIPAAQVSKLANTAPLQRWWDNYLTWFKFPQPPEAIYPEFSLSAPLPPYRLLAKFDLLARLPTGKFIIYDWKTNRKRPHNESLAIRWQTRVYRAMLAHAGRHLNGGKPIAPEQIEMVYWFAEFPSEPAHFPYSSSQYKRDWDALQGLATEIASAQEFPRTEDPKKCNWCTYRSYCNRGTQAAEGEPEESEYQTDWSLEQIGEIEL
ncbi:MAG: PD-(D/E)XK nuclease family protein [Anaerolineae bacterium]|nr:MAG: PD-(D/E)XK nuclease family protein [Anaerolineae bacterium]